MTVLTYRGKEYLQKTEVTSNELQTLSYSKTSFKERQQKAAIQVSQVVLKYRGLAYLQQNTITSKQVALMTYRGQKYTR